MKFIRNNIYLKLATFILISLFIVYHINHYVLAYKLFFSINLTTITEQSRYILIFISWYLLASFFKNPLFLIVVYVVQTSTTAINGATIIHLINHSNYGPTFIFGIVFIAMLVANYNCYLVVSDIIANNRINNSNRFKNWLINIKRIIRHDDRKIIYVVAIYYLIRLSTYNYIL